MTERPDREGGPGKVGGEQPVRTSPTSDDAPPGERPVFAHPQWTVGVALIFGVAAIIASFENPVWLLIGFPCILVLGLWVWVRWRTRHLPP